MRQVEVEGRSGERTQRNITARLFEPLLVRESMFQFIAAETRNKSGLHPQLVLAIRSRLAIPADRGLFAGSPRRHAMGKIHDGCSVLDRSFSWL